MSPWEIVIVAGAISYGLRVLPILAMRSFSIDAEGRLGRFLNYAAASVMGGIVYSALFQHRFYEDLLAHFQGPQLLAIATVAMTLVVSIATRSVLKTLTGCLAAYALLSWLLGM
jgi:branched-subunit amino acid transport protein